MTQEVSRNERNTVLYCSNLDMAELRIALLDFDMAFCNTRGPKDGEPEYLAGIPLGTLASTGQVPATACTEALAAYQVAVEAHAPAPPAYLARVFIPFLRIAARHDGFWVRASSRPTRPFRLSTCEH